MTAATRECLKCHATRIVSKHEHKSGDKCPTCGCVAYHENELFIASDVMETAKMLMAANGRETGYEEVAAMQMRRPQDYRIWWTRDNENTTLSDLSGLPLYVQNELNKRIGFLGRGRLWVAEGIPIHVQIGPLGDLEGWGGIAFHVEDLHCFKGHRGFITDLHGNIP